MGAGPVETRPFTCGSPQSRQLVPGGSTPRSQHRAGRSSASECRGFVGRGDRHECSEALAIHETTYFHSSTFAALEDGRVVFTADDGSNGAEPWVSDGTPEGTQLLRNINPGAAGSGVSGFASVSPADGAYDPAAPVRSPPATEEWFGA